jgi:hypothetical protein
MAYAIGNKSKAMCDICGRKFSYQHLREDWRGLKVCAVDFDSRHPQTERNAKTSDAIALRNARPDKDVDGTADWDDLDQLADIFTMHFGNNGLP